ncbi:MAG TPA: FhaA domain-containing protein [Dehalococcoidia bacterium]|nr:FhaA domain-containing protein [Dehalococcoidia bacterium]
MKPLSRLEALIAEVMERPAWLLGSRRLHPLELTGALTRALEERAVRLADRVIAPDRYELRVNPLDFAALTELRPLLEGELAEFLARTVAERDLACNRSPRVSIVAAVDVRQGRVAATAQFSNEPALDATAVALGAPPGQRSAVAPRAAQAVPPRRDAGAAYARLELVGPGGETLGKYPLHPGALIVGRRTGSDVILLDSKVSREHARIELTADGATIRDLGSLNGTRVNGELLTAPRRLHPGDMIEIGRARLRFAIA